MNQEIISEKQGVYLITVFIVAETFILTRGMEGKKDFWLAIILAILGSIPFMLLFSRLHSLYPHKDLLDINEAVFGKVLGKIINFLLSYYVATNMISVMSVFNYFVTGTSLSSTPRGVTYLCLSLLCIWVVKEGLEVMGRWTDFFFPLILLILFGGIMLLLPQMNIKNIQPFLQEGPQPVIKGGILTILFPLSETIAFTMIFTTLKNKGSFYTMYLKGLLYGGTLILCLMLTEVFVLGVESTLTSYFPGYQTFARINVSKILERLDIIAGSTFVLGGFIKISVLLLAVCRGISKIFNFKDYRFIVTPITLLIANISYFFYYSTFFMFEWISNIWGYFAFPFQILMPIIIWIGAEIKRKSISHKQRPS